MHEHFRLPLSRHATDRDDAGRSEPRLLARLVEDDVARCLLLWQGQALLRAGDGGPALDLRAPSSLAASGVAVAEAVHDRAVYLGRAEVAGRNGLAPGDRVVALVLEESEAIAVDAQGDAWASLREVADALDSLDCGLFTEALAMANWHAAHGFSPRTGARTVAEFGGWVRRVPGTEHVTFPRTDAAVIAAVTHGDRILLGANARWTPRRYSLLAGFVEPGESFEAAVAREVWEEAGARIIEPRYVGSQPWPFPASIMVGFLAELDPTQDPTTLRPDGTEIIDLRWFTRDELRAEAALLPSRISIARAIIETWAGGPLG